MNSPNKITEILAELKKKWTEPLDISLIERLCEENGYSWRERVLGPGETIQLFLNQILHGNTACSHLRYLSEFNFSAPSYCEARKRIPLEVFEELLKSIEQELDKESSSNSLWRGHRVWVGDGSGCSMPDTEELQSHFGQPSNQKKGCGFPVASLLALMNCKTGMLQKLIVSPLNTHDISKATELSSELERGDIIVYDQGFCSSALISQLLEQEVDSVMRVQPSHKVDFRKSQNQVNKGIRRKRVAKLGKGDQLIEWHKPRERPSWISEEQFASLPDFRVLREITYTLDRKAFRTKKVILVTTLTDRKKYPKAAIAELYGMRWDIETNFRHLKITMNMDTLKCKTVEGVKKELMMFAVVYNIVRQAMIERSVKFNLKLSRVSFVDTLRWIQNFTPENYNLTPIANPSRPGISAPRVVKKRPKAYPRMTSKRIITYGNPPKNSNSYILS